MSSRHAEIKLFWGYELDLFDPAILKAIKELIINNPEWSKKWDEEKKKDYRKLDIENDDDVFDFAMNDMSFEKIVKALFDRDIVMAWIETQGDAHYFLPVGEVSEIYNNGFNSKGNYKAMNTVVKLKQKPPSDPELEKRLKELGIDAQLTQQITTYYGY